MDINGKFLNLILTGITFTTLVSCFNSSKNNETYIYETETKYLKLADAVGTYYFKPSINENDYPNYKTFNLKKGDTLKLVIKTDSSFYFNHFYFDKMSKIDDYKGKITKSYDAKDKIQIPFPKGSFGLQGFLLLKKDTLFYHRLSMEHFDDYEYRLMYKKN